MISQYRSNCENFSKTADLLHETEIVQNKIHRSMENIAVEGMLNFILT